MQQAELGLRGGITNYTEAQYLGEYGPGIWRAEVRVKPEPLVIITAVPVNSSSAANETTKLLSPELELKSVAFQPMATAANIMAKFLPLVALFLTNDLFARLRATRAIEFLLARPITKGQLVTSRYSAGLLALLISSLLASAALGIIVYLMAGPVVTLSDVLVVFAASFASAAAFYSLLYLVSATTRKHFIAVAVILYHSTLPVQLHRDSGRHSAAALDHLRRAPGGRGLDHKRLPGGLLAASGQRQLL
ncbi:ABC transporter permease subunit [Acidilobus sp.]|uniref:ABC transporter permease subunit n=1 Tax=Acidilobus sp. TaxID=1872109 RepID=UPI003CFC86ED